MFKTIDTNLKTGKCPYCGTLSFIYYENDREMFLCHGCQRNIPADKVKYDNRNNPVQSSGTDNNTNKIMVRYGNLLSYCVLVDNLPSSHKCVQYLRDRGIDSSHWSGLYYTERFSKIAKHIGKDTGDEARLVIPFFDENGELFGLQGRSLNGEGLRYITLMFNEDEDKTYGLDKVNMDEQFVIVEGPLDSLFVDNCIAMAGISVIPNKYKPNAVVCIDNEPRNKQTVKKIKKIIDEGFKVVIWPQSIKENDINDMILKNVDVNTIIKENTYQGLTAKIKFNQWNKTNG